MIIAIDGINAHHFQSLLRQSYQLRARVFQDRLGWDVNVENGMETDVFDALNPTTLVSLNASGQVVGSMRILQTTGPNMLADVFYSILQGEPAPRSPLIWEATRLCVDTDRLNATGSPRARNSISYVTSEIMVAACEYAMDAGVSDAVAVIDPLMNRVLKRSGNAPYDYLGKATPMGKVTAMAGLLDCSIERTERLRERSDMRGDVFLDEKTAIVRFGDNSKKNLAASDAIRTYLSEQLQSADTLDELHATLKLISEIEK
ncbi:MAG: acyl-homoserine-lactone synthase [Planktotalea sp.]|jgi:N-acyl-L-homoserine lactone synthetase|uniref:acyl-homoserine-lactone synthase n=1 Tax=Planktotalea sp. TaxID=2029877 RepID=UPI000183A9E2|nr:acyl-homoserine-lactone synthase [Planktotalea sp.]EDZ43740.1 autoinducer synthesis protein [Rhodobacteraceae bacterium HTCC2083]MDG1076519.1 acyl-homoserine-lactone synthase [Planktotalea sp.]MDG1082589.1 acyl-homoserine-lactone synthase [Planktotalea sp.]HCW83205.1 GNAT family N-acetyltransferase [Paracoccaceae bacterium]